MVISVLLIFHILCGFLALLAGSAIVVLKKGTARHRRLGRWFYYAMVGIAFSAVVLALHKANDFLLFIALFSVFQSLGGRRVINNNSGKAGMADHLILALGMVTSLLMIFSMNGLLLFFGLLSLGANAGFARYCFSKDSRQRAYPARLRQHISLMGGSFIATVTAFVVVNVPPSAYQLMPSWLPWVLPTLVFTPIMTLWIRKYGKEETKAGDYKLQA